MKYEQQPAQEQLEQLRQQGGNDWAGLSVILEEESGEHPPMLALSRYLFTPEAEQDRAEIQRFSRHLAHCPQCRRLAEAMLDLEPFAGPGLSGKELEDCLEDILDNCNELSGFSPFSSEGLTLENLRERTAGEVLFHLTARWDGREFTFGETGKSAIRLTARRHQCYYRLSAEFREEVLSLRLEGQKDREDLPVLFLYPAGGETLSAEILIPSEQPDGRTDYLLEVGGLRREDFEAQLKISRYQMGR